MAPFPEASATIAAVMSTTKSASSSSATASGNASNSNSRSSALEYYLAIAVGIAFVVFWVIVVVFYCCRRGQSRHDDPESSGSIGMTSRRGGRGKNGGKMTIEDIDARFPITTVQNHKQKYPEFGVANPAMPTKASTTVQSADSTLVADATDAHKDSEHQPENKDVGPRAQDAQDQTPEQVIDSSIPKDPDVRDACPSCLEMWEETDNIRVLTCHPLHAFHDTCIVPWLTNGKSTCPICRHNFITGEVEAKSIEPRTEA